MQMPTPATVRRADSAADFERFGVDVARIAPSEDGLRIGTEPGNFEWWYFDAVLPVSKASVVVFFFTKRFMHPEEPLAPFVHISVALPGLPTRNGMAPCAPAQFRASTAACAVGIGASSVGGDLDTYRVDAVAQGIEVKLTLRRSVPSLRIGTGHLLFERDGAERFFGWLAAVPVGAVEVEAAFDGHVIKETGLGYHDHNWGNAELPSLIHDWYWGRAQVGPWTVIASQITTQAAYGGVTHTDLTLIRDGTFIARGSDHAAFWKDAGQPDPRSGKPVSDLIRFTFDDGQTRCVVEFLRQQTVQVRSLDDTGALPQTGADPQASGAYHRFLGQCTLVVTQAEEAPVTWAPVVALWELMWFGNGQDPSAVVPDTDGEAPVRPTAPSSP